MAHTTKDNLQITRNPFRDANSAPRRARTHGAPSGWHKKGVTTMRGMACCAPAKQSKGKRRWDLSMKKVSGRGSRIHLLQHVRDTLGMEAERAGF
jgi:hypothetical protein